MILGIQPLIITFSSTSILLHSGWGTTMLMASLLLGLATGLVVQ